MERNLPTGTVTMLFTDIEGSTGWWESDPESMRPALARHDRILRETIEDAGGYVFSTAGDAFCAAFDRPAAAAKAAIDVQTTLAEQRWPRPRLRWPGPPPLSDEAASR